MIAKTRHALLIVAAGLICSAGCENQTLKAQRENGETLSAALEKIQEAELGYVPTFQGKPVDDLGTYRQKRLDAARAELAKLTEKAPEFQQVAVSRLLADAQASAALDNTHKAMIAWAGVANHSAKLLSQLIAMSRAENRARMFDIDETTLLSDLHQEQRKRSRQLTELKGKATDLSQAIGTQEAEISDSFARRDRSLAQAQSHRDEAFKKSGQAQFDEYLDAKKAQREGETHNVQAEKTTVRLEVNRSALAILKTQIELKQDAVGNIQSQINAAQQRQKEADEEKRKALAQKNEIIEDMVSTLEEIATTFDAKVEARLDDARQKLDKAVQSLERASERARREEKRATQLDLLAKLVMKMHVLAEQIVALDGFGHTLAVVAVHGQELMPQRVEAFSSIVEAQEEKRRQLAAEVEKAVNQAKELTEPLKGAPEEVAAIAERHEQQIAAYNKRILKVGQ